MRRFYTSSEITKNWRGSIPEDACGRNIFCYGKSGSGKTERVCRPTLQYAIRNGRSCAIFSKDTMRDFGKEILMAKVKGYEILQLEPDIIPLDIEYMDEDEVVAARNMLAPYVDTFLAKPTIVFFDDPDFDDPFHVTTWGYFMEGISTTLYNQNCENKCAHIIMDGLCGNEIVMLDWIRCEQLRFCITTCSDIARKSWREDKVANAMDFYFTPENLLKRTGYESPPADTAIGQMMDVMSYFVCTGASDVSPAENRAFAGTFCYGKETSRAGGNFYIAEQYADETITNLRAFISRKPMKSVNDENLKNSMSGRFGALLCKGYWVAEENGRLMVYDSLDWFTPIAFHDERSAKEWVLNYYSNTAHSVRFKEGLDGLLIYDVLKNNGISVEVTLTRIAKEDEKKLQDRYFIKLLEMAEEASFIAEYAETQGRNAAKMKDEEFVALYHEYHAYVAAEQEKAAAAAAAKANTPFVIPEEYRWKPYEAPECDESEQDEECTTDENERVQGSKILPESNVLFLGGHQNMTKKLRQIFPNWTYLSDDLFKEIGQIDTVFFWTKHSSHSMMEFVACRKSDDAKICYVTATNIKRLIKEMEEQYLTQVSAKEVVA